MFSAYTLDKRVFQGNYYVSITTNKSESFENNMNYLTYRMMKGRGKNCHMLIQILQVSY